MEQQSQDIEALKETYDRLYREWQVSFKSENGEDIDIGILDCRWASMIANECAKQFPYFRFWLELSGGGDKDCALCVAPWDDPPSYENESAETLLHAIESLKTAKTCNGREISVVIEFLTRGIAIAGVCKVK